MLRFPQLPGLKYLRSNIALISKYRWSKEVVIMNGGALELELVGWGDEWCGNDERWGE